MKFSKNSIFVMFVVLLLSLFASTKYFVVSTRQQESDVKIKIIPTDYEGETVLKPVSEKYHAEINLEYSLFWARFNTGMVDSGVTGEMVVSFTKSCIEVRGNLSNISYVGWLGGAGIFYGLWDVDENYYHPEYVLPKKLSELPNTVLLFNYTIYEDISTLPITTTIELFIPNSTRYSDEEGTIWVDEGDIIVYITLYRSPELFSPIYYEVVEMPIFINGTLTKAKFGVNVRSTDPSGYVSVSFDIAGVDFGGVSLSGVEKGEVGIPIQELINTIAKILTTKYTEYDWSEEEIYNNILRAIGVIIGAHNNYFGVSEGDFMWRIYELSFVVKEKEIEETPTTMTITVTTTVVETVTRTVPSPVVETRVFTLTITEKVEIVNWGFVAGLGAGLLVVGIAIGLIIKKIITK